MVECCASGVYRIHEDVVERLTSWTYSGFNGHVGEAIAPEDTHAREMVARYLVRSCVSLEKMTYVPREGKVWYGDAFDIRINEALDFLALLSCHITNRWERRVIAYGYCLPSLFQGSLLPIGGSNKSRGMRKKQEKEMPGDVQVIEPKLYPKGHH